MQVLVAAVRADAGATSEGICTARAVRLLAARGHEVRLLVSTAGPQGSGRQVAQDAVGPQVEVVEVDTGASAVARLGHRSAGAGRRYRPDLPAQALTGFGLEDLAAGEAWRRALAREEQRVRPDVTWARGAGLDVHPLLARQRLGGAWVAHLHDPWPLSWYPPSYVARARVVSARQESAARHVLRRAPVITVPSDRLLSWTAQRSGVELQGRAHVVPHLGGDPGRDDPAPADGSPEGLLPGRSFVLCHAGTLLGPRDPTPLVAGFERFLQEVPEARHDAGLALVGPLDRRHRGGAALQERLRAGQAAGWLRVEDRRIGADLARAVVAAAQVGVVVEAPDPASPFFPAKLADLLALGVPVLALVSTSSTVADLVGPAHPLRAAPTDVAGIADAVARAWRAWRAGTLVELLPPERSRRAVTAAEVGPAVERALEAAVSAAAGGGAGRRRGR